MCRIWKTIFRSPGLLSIVLSGCYCMMFGKLTLNLMRGIIIFILLYASFYLSHSEPPVGHRSLCFKLWCCASVLFKWMNGCGRAAQTESADSPPLDAQVPDMVSFGVGLCRSLPATTVDNRVVKGWRIFEGQPRNLHHTACLGKSLRAFLKGIFELSLKISSVYDADMFYSAW